MSATQIGPTLATACKMFTLFPELPTELRLVIWKMALPGTRILKSTSSYMNPSDKSPAILFTCRESRTVALRHYQPISLSLRERLYNAKIQYFDPLIDILFYNEPLSIFDSSQHDEHDAFFILATRIPGIRRLAIFESTIYYKPEIDARYFAGFDYLEEIILLHANDSRGEIRTVSHVETFEDNCEEEPVEDEYHLARRVRTLRRSFGEHEEANAGWKAPKIWCGRLIKKKN